MALNFIYKAQGNFQDGISTILGVIQTTDLACQAIRDRHVNWMETLANRIFDTDAMCATCQMSGVASALWHSIYVKNT